MSSCALVAIAIRIPDVSFTLFLGPTVFLGPTAHIVLLSKIRGKCVEQEGTCHKPAPRMVVSLSLFDIFDMVDLASRTLWIATIPEVVKDTTHQLTGMQYYIYTMHGTKAPTEPLTRNTATLLACRWYAWAGAGGGMYCVTLEYAATSEERGESCQDGIDCIAPKPKFEFRG